MRNQIASRLPLIVLTVACLASFAARAAWIGLPCHASCRTPSSHLLVFDERYYVNAARVIAGIRPPAGPGAAYRHAPLGSDPNAEHPQLAKLVMAGSIELFGDGPWGWRLGSLIFGTLAILGMFALVRWGGGPPWMAVGAAVLMASDNLLLVQGRIGTLDIYVVAAMIWSVALWMRGHPLLAGLVGGVAACMKLFALDIVPILVWLEVFYWRSGARSPARQALLRLTGAVAVLGATLIALLALLDQIAPPYDNSVRRLVSGGPLGHLGHMVSYGTQQTGLGGASAIASPPWQWLGDYRPIAYLTLDPVHPGALRGDHPAVHFLGLISPPVLLAGLVGTALALWGGLGPRRRAGGQLTWGDGDGQPLRLAAAWFLGTFGPFLILGEAFDRTTYLYYMTVVMPGMYLAAAWLASRLWHRRWLVSAWLGLVVVATVLLYPFTPLP